MRSRIWLFGSRADDIRRGGDIDLLVETDAELSNRAQGGRAAKDGVTPGAPVFEIAKRTGGLL